IYKELYFANSWKLAHGFKHQFTPGGGSGCDVSISNQPCVVAGHVNNPALSNVTTTFDISLSYTFFDLVRWDLGDQNETGNIAEDGRHRSVFYSPDAAFYMDVIAMFDGVYEKYQEANKKKTASERFSHTHF